MTTTTSDQGVQLVTRFKRLRIIMTTTIIVVGILSVYAVGLTIYGLAYGWPDPMNTPVLLLFLGYVLCLALSMISVITHSHEKLFWRSRNVLEGHRNKMEQLIAQIRICGLTVVGGNTSHYQVDRKELNRLIQDIVLTAEQNGVLIPPALQRCLEVFWTMRATQMDQEDLAMLADLLGTLVRGMNQRIDAEVEMLQNVYRQTPIIQVK